MVGELAPKTKVKRKKRGEPLWQTFLKDFCSHTTIHGLNHISEQMFTPFERTLWGWLFVLACIGASYSSGRIWERYRTGSTATYVETTRYHYSNVPFPAVTVCDASRVHWPRALDLGPRDLPPPFNVTKEKTLLLLQGLAYVTFGDFDFLDSIRTKNISLEEIDGLNISHILLKVMRPCDEVFPKLCAWRGAEHNCCRLFELQKSELGFCYSFNSDTSEASRRLSYGWEVSGRGHWRDERGEMRPRRTAQTGLWGGLRFAVAVLPTSQLPPERNQTTTGIDVMVNDPRAWPMEGYTEVGAGQFGVMDVWGDALVTEPRARSVLPEHRKCLFPDEAESPLGQYLALNCRTACFQDYARAHCNCSPDFIFHNYDNKGNLIPACNATGLLCLSEHNDILTYEVPAQSQGFFDNTGMQCDCVTDCNSQRYVSGLTISQTLNESDLIYVDVHYKMSSCVLYKTDIRYDYLDIIVAFGGIAGLFLGASLMSGVELLYFITVRFYYIHKERKSKIASTKIVKTNPPAVLPWIY